MNKLNKFNKILLAVVFVLLAGSFISVSKAEAYSSTIVNTDHSPFVAKSQDIEFSSDGYPRIISLKSSSAAIRYQVCGNSTCTSVSTTDIPVTSADFMTLSMNGTLANIAYYDSTQYDVIFIQCTDSTCNTRNTTTIANESSSSWANPIVRMASDGFARLLYRNASGTLSYRQCTNGTCSTGTTTTVDSGTSTLYNYFELGTDGFARIVFRTASNNIRFLKCTNASCSTKSTTNITVTDVSELNIALTSSNLPFILYRLGPLGTTDDVRLLQCTNDTCSTRNDTLIESQGPVYHDMQDLFVGDDGNARLLLSSNNGSGTSIYYAKYYQCTNAACSTSANRLLTGLNNGYELAMTKGSDGYPRVTYRNAPSPQQVVFGLCVNDSCTVPPTPTPTLTPTPSTTVPVLASTPSQTGMTNTAITLGGNVTSNGGAALTARGVCYSLTATDSTPGFTTAGGSTPETGVTCTNEGGTTTGIFTIPQVTGLTPSTAYSFRAFARNSVGNGYSNVGSFTTYGPPSTTTSAAGSITTDSAILNSTINPNGASTNVSYLWGTVEGVDCEFQPNTLAGPTGLTGTSNLSGATTQASLSTLSGNTTYYFCVMATNSYGTNYGSVTSFTTSPNTGAYTYMDAASALGSGATDCQDNPSGAPCAPVNSSGTNGTNPGAAAASTTQINLSWGVNSIGGAVPVRDSYDVYRCGLNQSACGSPSIVNVSSATTSYSNSGITCSASPYYYRIVAKNANGDTQSNIFSGTTSTCAVAPTVTTPTSSSITSSGATLGANVTSDGGATITSRGTCWGLSTNPTGNCASTSGTTGVFTHARTGMPVNTLIYYRGYATNSQGTSYSTSSSFTTLGYPRDTFTDTNGVLLENHTMDVGTGWTKLIDNGTGNINISSNQITDASGTDIASSGELYATIDTISTANYKVFATMVTGDSSDDYNILAGRIQDANNMYAVEFNNSQIRLYRRVSGTWMQMGSTAAGAANGSVITLNMDGTNISVLDDGTALIVASDSAISGAGKAGIGLGNIVNSGGDFSAQVLDSFETAAAQTGVCINGYLDNDGDGHGAVSYGCYTSGTIVQNNTDCYDNNALAYLGQTNSYSTHRGDNSFDYNCSGTEEPTSLDPWDPGSGNYNAKCTSVTYNASFLTEAVNLQCNYIADGEPFQLLYTCVESAIVAFQASEKSYYGGAYQVPKCGYAVAIPQSLGGGPIYTGICNAPAYYQTFFQNCK